MAVFKQELNWSTYQNNQLEVLKSIERAFNSSLLVSKNISTNLSKIEYAMEHIGRELVGDVDKFNEGISRAGEALGNFDRQLGRSGDKAKEFGDNVDRAGKNFVTTLQGIGKNLWEHLGNLSGIGKEVDNFSKISNSMIQLSGMTGGAVREFRSEIMSVVADLNMKTGHAYSPQDSYEKIVSMSQGVTSSLEAMEELARPLLLAEQSLDVNINSVAELFNRFYTKYSFNSANMEETLNGIRGNTAGNSANAEATLKNINELEAWINNYAVNDNNLRTELLDKISNYTSWIESMNMDSSPFTSWIKSAAYGDWSSNPEMLQILSRSGIGAVEATNMAQTGQYEDITVAMMRGVYSIMEQFDKNKDGTIEDTYALGAILDNYGLSRDLALDIWNTMNSNGFTSFDDFVKSTVSNPGDMEKLVEDKYVSAADKTNHWLEQIYALLASAQEHLGFGLTDAALVYSLLGGRGGVGNLGSSIKGLANASAMRGAGSSFNMAIRAGSTAGSLPGTGALSSVAAAGGGLGGAAMMSGGLLAGGALAWDGIKGIFDKNNSEGEKAFSALEAAGGIGGAAALIGLGITNPVGWAALAVGGVGLLGKKIIDEANDISGNAKEVEKAFSDIEKSLKQERSDRIRSLGELKIQFNEASSLEEQKNLILSAGLATEEELLGKNESALGALIDAYLEGAKSFSDITDTYLKKREKEIKDEQGNQQNSFIEALKSGVASNYVNNKDGTVSFSGESQAMYDNIVDWIISNSSDEKLTKKLSKYRKSGGHIDPYEFAKITNKTWDDANLVESALPVELMQSIVGAYGSELGISDMKFSTYDPSKIAAESALLEGFRLAWGTFTANPEVGLDQLNRYIATMIKDENYNAIRDDLAPYRVASNGTYQSFGIQAFAEGTNYITRNQLAYLHEGEAVVPKKYNPAANNEELNRAIDYLESSQNNSNRASNEFFGSLLDELREIREFLSSWKDDNIKRERLSEIRAKNGANSRFISNYMTTV